MIRSLIALALSVLLVAEAGAQTVPAKSKSKSTKSTVRANRREVKKARRVALEKPPVAQPVNDGWPPIETSETAVASTATVAAPAAYEAPAASPRGELDNANVYAAPGRPVHIRTSNVPVPYSVRPPRKPAGRQTTLTPGN